MAGSNPALASLFSCPLLVCAITATANRGQPPRIPVTETYRIFAWKEGAYWRGQSLISQAQISTMLGILGWRKEVFASIQSYDQYHNCIGSPLYFDFDGPPDTVTADVRHFVQACEFVVNVTPKIYFSGNKGFHLIIDHLIEHPMCHLLVQDFADEIAFCSTLDKKVYRSNALFRIPGSPGSAKGFYKVPITRDELMTLTFEQLREFARTRRQLDDTHDPSKIDNAVMNDWMKCALRKLPRFDHLTTLIQHSESMGMEMTPCIQRMLTEPQPQGTRHECVFILARFFKLCGLDLETTKTAFDAQPHWCAYEAEEREITKVLRSVFYSSKHPLLGCKGRTYSAELMRDHCDKLCHFSPDFPKLAVTDLKGKIHIV